MSEPNKKVHPLSDQELINRMKDKRGNIINGSLFIRLRNRYLPLIKSLYAKCYAKGMVFDDWLQESSMVLMVIIHSYNHKRKVRFQTYFYGCLKNHFYDIIRHQHAGKRIPNNYLISYNANQNYYDDVLVDIKAPHPERSVIFTDMIKRLMKKGSIFENKVIVGLLHHQSFVKIAKRNHCPVSKVKNAFERCKIKYNKMRDNGLD